MSSKGVRRYWGGLSEMGSATAASAGLNAKVGYRLLIASSSMPDTTERSVGRVSNWWATAVAVSGGELSVAGVGVLVPGVRNGADARRGRFSGWPFSMFVKGSCWVSAARLAVGVGSERGRLWSKKRWG